MFVAMERRRRRTLLIFSYSPTYPKSSIHNYSIRHTVSTLNFLRVQRASGQETMLHLFLSELAARQGWSATCFWLRRLGTYGWGGRRGGWLLLWMIETRGRDANGFKQNKNDSGNEKELDINYLKDSRLKRINNFFFWYSNIYSCLMWIFFLSWLCLSLFVFKLSIFRFVFAGCLSVVFWEVMGSLRVVYFAIVNLH